ncbi:hypothetical protein LCGC14_0476150 [marine sediment metagenome]|uniref:DNA-directed DNA polymerase family A palm domain-containing protein n=1 Tax=marine sediment metagenome TaxID=412755 RepID=A0A0F9VJK9_9ZZZZ
MNLTFPTYPECADCNLHTNAKNRGVPTRPLQVTGKDTALVFVGESLGYNENLAGKSWVGYAGQLLEKLIAASKLGDLCDIYLSNACRCYRPQSISMTQGYTNKCRPYLQKDIEILQRQYKNVVLFACGGPATYSISKIKTLALAFRNQGIDSKLFGDEGIPCFFTNHPAILHPSRKPALIGAIEAHFNLVRRYLTGDIVPQKVKVEPLSPMYPPLELPDRISLDIETYGILKGVEQTVFNPVKSKYIDGIEFGKQIETVSIGLWDGDGSLITYLFQFGRRDHRAKLVAWLERVSQQGKTIVGQNIKFDVLYLIHNCPLCAYWLAPNRMKLDDTLLLGFLLYDQSPEKGLKEIAVLRGYGGYEDCAITAKHGTASGPTDPDLHYYNCLDAGMTLLLDRDCREDIGHKYGKNTPKLNAECAALRNAIIWDTVELEKNGCCLDTAKLSKLKDDSQTVCDLLQKELKKSGVIVAGEGSEKSLREFVWKAADECGLLGDKRLGYTKSDKKICIDKGNIALLQQYLIEGALAATLKNITKFKATRDIISRYAKPLQTKPRKGIVMSPCRGRGIVYPSWYPIPSYHSRGGSQEDKGGGTVQGRFSAQKPSVPTFPPLVKECMACRKHGYKLIVWDLSQIELRMAALLSGDPFMMDDYMNGRDRHAATAKDILYPGSSEEDEDWNDKRQLAKKENFLVLYRGGWRRLQEVAREEMGLSLPDEYCKEAVRAFYRKHSVFYQWQESEIEKAARKGYTELPTGWSRSWGLGKQGVSAYINEICNFPIQTLSAQLMQSAQFAFLQRLYEGYMLTKIVSYAYDALYLEVAIEEEEWVDRELNYVLTRPPILPTIEKAVGRSVPIEYSKEVLCDAT